MVATYNFPPNEVRKCIYIAVGRVARGEAAFANLTHPQTPALAGALFSKPNYLVGSGSLTQRIVWPYARWVEYNGFISELLNLKFPPFIPSLPLFE